MDFIRVDDKYVQLKAPAVLLCRLTSSSSSSSLPSGEHSEHDDPPSWSRVDHRNPLEELTSSRIRANTQVPLASRRPDYTIEWFTSDGLQIRPTDWPLAEGEKFVAFDTGELHLASVDMADLRRTYGCRLRNRTSRRQVAISNMAQLILIEDNKSSSSSLNPFGPPQIKWLHTTTEVIVVNSDLSGENHRDAPHYASSQTTIANRIRAHLERDQSEDEERLPDHVLLPCAVRVSAAVKSAKGRWLYRPPQASDTLGRRGGNGGDSDDPGARPIGLEQLVGIHKRWLQLIDQTSSPAAGHRNQSMPTGGGGGSKLLIRPTFLAIERPRKQLSGRYIYQLLLDDGQQQQRAETICDINVIVSEPIRLRMAMGGRQSVTAADNSAQTPVMGALTSGDATSTLTRWFGNWLIGSEGPTDQRRYKRTAANDDDHDDDDKTREDTSTQDLLGQDPSRIQVTGPGSVPQTPIVRVGDRLELQCLAQGHPVDSVRWFRQGRAINTQSSSDFQTEITTTKREQTAGEPTTGPTTGGGGGGGDLLVSRLLIRQLQPRELGLQMFECFAQNSLGDRARASQAVLVVDRRQVSEARNECPLDEFDTHRQGDDDDEPNEMTTTTSGPSGFASARSGVQAVFQGQNPFRRALVLEGEPIELHCPIPSGSNDEQQQRQIEWLKWTTPPAGGHTGPGEPVNADHHHHHHQATDLKQQSELATSATRAEHTRRQHTERARQFNQLFGGESRFVINGSSLQIRSPSKRHDETLFVCARRWRRPRAQRHGRLAIDGPGASPNKLADPSSGQRAQQADFGHDSGSAGLQRHHRRHYHSVHQSSLAAPPPPPLLESPFGPSEAADHQAGQSCMESLFSLAASASVGAGEQGAGAHHDRQQHHQVAVASAGAGPPLVSSISIRIVARPRIDPFEFSRDLEEGMRTVVVCTVVSGQSQVDINWFKDGELLLMGAPGDKENDGLEVDSTNKFSSTLTLHKIRPSHSGHYTCVVSNAFASAEHTSRLLVNVAPYFVEPPKSQRAYLGSSVLINCRAAGQPSPQIRWRKLVPVGGATGEQKLPASAAAATDLLAAPSGGGPSSQQSSKLAADSAFYLSSDFDFRPNSMLTQQMALAAGAPASGDQQQQQQQQQHHQLAAKHEFRIITSNSHIQVLENGSMIIRDVELADAARYSCQASNGVQPVLSEVIHLDVLTPAQFEVNYEKVSVKRDSLVRFNCAPRGDQPMQIEWFKEGQQLVRSAAGSRANELNGAQPPIGARPTKYSELIKVIDLQQQQQPPPPTDLNVNTSQSMRHFQLMLLEVAGRAQQSKPEAGGLDSNRRAANVNRPDLITFNQEVQNKSSPTVISSELIIDSADRADSGLFVCVASNLYGKDELSYRLLVQEPPDAPLNLQVQAIQSSSLRLLWQTPFDGNTPISYFIVEYRKLPQPASGGGGPSSLAVAATSGATANQVWSRVVVSHSTDAGPEEQPPPPPPPPPGAALMSAPATTTPAAKTNSVALKQLAPKSSYQIRVAAVNPIGQGLFSPIQLVSTAEEAPQTKPADLRAQALSSSSIKLMWRGLLAQPQDQAPVRGYYVSHRRHSPTPETTPTSWLATVSLSATNYSSALDDNLLPIINQIDQQQQQQQVSPGQLVNYELQLGSLERNAKYEVRVQPFNLMGLGPAAELTVQTLKFDRPAQPVMRLVAARKQSLELKWSVVANELTGAQTNQSEGGELQGFSLYYKCEYDDWREISLAVIFHYVVDNLRCGNKYQIYLSAYNSVGRSDPSDVLSVRTEGSVPLAPERAIFFKLNISEVVLDMASWSSGGCPISSFMIQFKRLHDSNWYILSEGATPFTQTDKITIPDLAPASWYKLMVNALNEAGSTNAEYIFATLTLDGQQLSPPDYLLDLQQQPLRPNKSTSASSLWAALSLLLSGGGGGGRNQDSPLLLPLSCILLLTVTSLATYLYYSKHADARRAANKQLRSALGKPKQCAAHPTLNNHLQPGGAGGNLQMLDRHLLGASHSSCLNGLVGGGATADSASSSGSSSSAAQQQQQQRQGAQHRHHLLSRTMTLHRPTGHHHHLQLLQQQQQQQIEKQHLIQSHLPGAMSSKSQLVLSHDGGLCGATNAGGGYLSQQQVRLLLNHQSDPPPNVAHQQNYTGNQPVDALPSAAAAAGDDQQLTNYVLDTFLNQQVSSSSSSGGGGGGASQQTSFVCGSQPVGGACRAATMKLFTGSGNPAPERRQSNSYFDCGASSSLSSSGLGGSAHTTTSNQHPNQLHLIGECEGQQQPSSSSPPPPPLDGYELNLNDQLLACGAGSCQYETQQQQHQEQSHVDLVHQQQQHRLLASSSFASAADLIQRQQQLQQQAEPIYQRLDRFKACALPACVRQFATMNPHMANKLKQQFEQHSTDPIDTHETVAMSMASEQPVAIDTGACFYPPPFAASGDYNHQQECDAPAAYDLRQQSESHNADLC